ncbi:MAG: LamG-like jellyroll fold domain-containing protein [Minisyncoccales bacterium]
MNKQKSFTLIELLVVIVIIGILAGVIMISTSSSIDKANFAKAQAFSSTVQNELLSNLVSEWTFNNPSNIGEDTWGNNHGTLYNFANPATSTSGLASANECVFGTCLKFDGVNDYIDCGNDSNLYPKKGSLTVSGWVYHKDYTTYPKSLFPIGTSDAYQVGISGWQIGYASNVNTGINVVLNDGINKVADFMVWDNGYKPNDIKNSWAHIVVVFDRNNGKSYSYVNGIKQSGEVNISNVGGEIINNRIVKLGNQQGWMMDGLIDDIRIYNTALSSSQIKQNYIAGLNSMLANGNISKEDYNERINALAYDN